MLNAQLRKHYLSVHYTETSPFHFTSLNPRKHVLRLTSHPVSQSSFASKPLISAIPPTVTLDEERARIRNQVSTNNNKYLQRLHQD